MKRLLLFSIVSFVISYISYTHSKGWYYYNYDMYCSRLYPYASEKLTLTTETSKELYFKESFVLPGSARYAGVGEILKDILGLEILVIEDNKKLKLLSSTGKLLFQKEYKGLGTLALDNIIKDEDLEVIVGMQLDDITYGVEVIDFSTQSVTREVETATAKSTPIIIGSVTKTLIIGTFTKGSLIRVQPRTIQDIDYDSNLELILTVGVGKNYKPGYLYVYDYESEKLIFKVDIETAKTQEPNGEYPVILLSGGSPYSLSNLDFIDTDGYIIGFNMKGRVSWKHKTNTWLIRSITTNLVNPKYLEDLVVIQGPPESKVYVLNTYTGRQRFAKISTSTSKELVYKEEGVSFLSGAVADLNKDGEKEIIVGCSDNQIRLLNKNLELIATQTFKAIPYVRVINDINGDGFMEIIVSSSNELSVLDYNLLVIGTYAVSSLIDEIILSDIDLDNKNDLIVCNGQQTSVIKLTEKETTVVVMKNPKYPELGTVTVWPGNTNNDKIVNEFDIIPIAKNWYEQGPSRGDNAEDWIAQKVGVWQKQAATFADTNGDGIVDQKDILLLAKHWGKEINQDKYSDKAAPAVKSLKAKEIDHVKELEKFRLMYKELKEGVQYEHTKDVELALIKLMNYAFLLSSPQKTQVLQAYPNPFRAECWIPFSLASQADEIILKIYNVSGQLIKVLNLQGNFTKGDYKACRYDSGEFIRNNRDITRFPHAIYWDGKDDNYNEVASGIYFYQLIVKEGSKVIANSVERVTRLR